MNEAITWRVDFKLASLVIAEYEDFTFFVNLNPENYREGFEPFLVIVMHDGKDGRFVECDDFERVVSFIDDFVNGHPQKVDPR